MKARTLVGGGLLWLAAAGTNGIAQQGRGERVADAKPGDLRILVTAAIRTPLEAVRAEAEKAVGHHLVIQYGSARGNLKDTILQGQGFDVAMLLPDVDAQLLEAGKILPKSVEIARVPVAFGLRGDATVNVSTPDAVRGTILKAKALRWAPTGAALLTVNKVLDTLAIRKEAEAKHVLQGTAELGPGDYEINIFPLSEILDNKALKNLGPVIPALQAPATITAVVAKEGANVVAANKFIAFLQGPAIGPELTKSGMTR